MNMSVTELNKPFLLNDVFSVGDFSQSKVSYKIIDGLYEGLPETISVIEVENVFSNLPKIRSIVDQTPISNWKYTEAGDNFKNYYDCRLRYPVMAQFDLYDKTRELVKEYFSVNTRVFGNFDMNWFKQINDKESDWAFPHVDSEEALGLFSVLIYGNFAKECDGGTAFFWCKDLDNIPVEDGSKYWSTSDIWEYRLHIPMEENKMVIFPSNFYHAAYHPTNHWKEFPRLTFNFRLQIV